MYPQMSRHRERERERAILAERKYRNYIVITFITCENNVMIRTRMWTMGISVNK